MRIRSCFVTGLVWLLAGSASAAGPSLRTQSRWIFGARCAVTFDAAGPHASLLANDAFATDGFSAVWNDPRTGELMAYGDGIHVWRGSDHALLYEDPTARPQLQTTVAFPNPTTAGVYTFLSASLANEDVLQRTTRVRLVGAPLVSTTWIVPGVVDPLTLLLTADGMLGPLAIPYWTSRTDPRSERVLVGGVEAQVDVIPGGFGFGPPETPTPNGATASMSWDGRTHVYLHAPGLVLVGVVAEPRGFPGGSFSVRPTVEALEAGDTTGRVHHALLSPDGTKLYVGIDDGDLGDRADVVQIDLAAGNARTVLGRALGRHSPSFQLAPDGRIYVGSFQDESDVDALGVIVEPDAAGAAATFDPAGLPLVAGCDVRRGLVSFAQGGMRWLDTDEDGWTDDYDADNDQDGRTDAVESGDAFYGLDNDPDANGLFGWNEGAPLGAAVDHDADGYPSADDLDSDGDGLPDLWECGALALDADRDGHVDGPVRPGGQASAAFGADGQPLIVCADSDADGLVNPLDLDSDNDGLGDRVEASGATGPDADQDGWADLDHEAVRVGMARDSDSDGTPDWLDATDDTPKPDGGADDAGVPDAGAADAGEADAGTEADASAVGDAGSVSDAGAAVDAGGSANASSGGPVVDAGLDPVADDDAGAVGGGGCACRAAVEPAGGAPSAALLLGMVLWARSRKRRTE